MADAVARAVLLLFGRDGARANGSFEADVVEAADLVRARIAPADGTVRVGVALDDDPLAAIARERNIRLLEGAVEVTLPDPAAITTVVAALDGFGERANGSVDTDASIAVAGTCHLVRAETGPIMLASTGLRKAGISREEHSEWWLHVHGPMSMRLVPSSLGYQQLHGDPDASRAAAASAGLGGPATDFAETAYFESVEAFTTPMADPDVGRELVEDEAGFIDHASVVAAMCRLAAS
jgi:hypothetical protein